MSIHQRLTIDKLRSIIQSNIQSTVLQKWFLRSLRPTLRQEINPSIVHSYGFRRCTSASQVTGLVRQLQFLADTWKLPLVTALQDVQTAFDSMPHALISRSMLARGVSPQMTGLHIRELTAMNAYIWLLHCGKTEMFQYTKGGKQGGIETPDEWRAVVDSLMEPIVRKWNHIQFGFHLHDEHGEPCLLVNHAVWADNIIVFASSFEMLQTMVLDLNSVFALIRTSYGSQYFLWKPSSL